MPEEQPADGFAYVFYATADDYACAALVNIYRLQDLLHTRHRIVALVSSHVSQPYVDALRGRNVTVISHEPPPLAEGSVSYYKDVLLKLVSFGLHRQDSSLKRVLTLDSDQLLLKNLDGVFDLPHVDLAAPRAYWIGKDTICSAFMLIELSDRLADRVETGLKEIHPDKYDMDLINELLDEEVMMLPGRYVTLNSHWEDWNLPKWYTGRNVSELATSDSHIQQTLEGEPQAEDDSSGSDNDAGPGAMRRRDEHTEELSKDLYALYEQADVLHFTALGKPWTFMAEEVARQRPDAHPLFREQFATWRRTAEMLCPRPEPLNHTFEHVTDASGNTWGEISADSPTDSVSYDVQPPGGTLFEEASTSPPTSASDPPAEELTTL